MLESYRDLTDEQLIAALKNSGDPDGKIMDYILDKYKPLVRKKANAVFLIGGETDDLIQEGMIGLFKAIRDYDDTKETSFFHFAELCITRQLYKAVEASNRKKQLTDHFYPESHSRILGEVQIKPRSNFDTLMQLHVSFNPYFKSLVKNKEQHHNQRCSPTFGISHLLGTSLFSFDTQRSVRYCT